MSWVLALLKCHQYGTKNFLLEDYDYPQLNRHQFWALLLTL